jgi:tRNA dimethylallyltransferase
LRSQIDTVTPKQIVFAVIGPSGVGKSRLAIDLAVRFNGEIVNADSRQVYRDMDIGTAKPSRLERNQVPHHLFDIIDPGDSFSLAEYQKLAGQAIHDIHRRRKIPFLVGGSGQYVWGVLEGWQIPHIPPDFALRAQLAREADETGSAALYQKLIEIDPGAAQRIDCRNVRRVIRALEVALRADSPHSSSYTKKAPDFAELIIGLTAARPVLYHMIDQRVDRMIDAGLIEETCKLIQKGYRLDLPAMSSIGYRQAGQLINNEMDRDRAIEQIKTETHRFVRHQYAWFKLNDRRILWFDVQGQIAEEIMILISNFLELTSI